MRIGVDIDAVLNYRQQVIITYGTKYCVETGKGSLINPDAHRLREMFDWDQVTRDDFWYKYGKYQMIEWPAVVCAAEVIAKLRAEGHQIWIITGRNDGDDRIDGMPDGASWEEVTKDWLARNQIEYDGFGFGVYGTGEVLAPGSKGLFCKEHQISIMIEDSLEYLETFDESVKLLIYDQPYNRNFSNANSERVYSWYDVYDKVKKHRS